MEPFWGEGRREVNRSIAASGDGEEQVTSDLQRLWQKRRTPFFKGGGFCVPGFWGEGGYPLYE